MSFGSEGLYAYDVDGKLLWKRDLGVLNAGWFYDPDYEWGVGSSPIIWKNLVIVQCDIQKNSFVAAFDVATGQPVWRTRARRDPVVVDADHLRGRRPRRAGDAGHDVHPRLRSGHRQGAVAADGQLRDHDPDADRRPRPRHRHQRLLAACSRSTRSSRAPPATSRSKAIRRRTSSIAWSTNRGGPYMPTPIIYGDLLYVLANNGVLAAYDVRTGQRVYQERVGGGGSFSASPVAADGKLYLTSEDGDVFVVKAGPTYELLATNADGRGPHGDAGDLRRRHHHPRAEARHRHTEATGQKP